MNKEKKKHKSEENLYSILNLYGVSQEARDRANELLTTIGRSGISSVGKTHLERYLEHGEVLPRGSAIKAKCYDCSAYYSDGREDCRVHTCPLYPYSPYGKFRRRYVRKQKEESRGARQRGVLSCTSQ